MRFALDFFKTMNQINYQRFQLNILQKIQFFLT